MNSYYSEYLDNIKYLIQNKDKLKEKEQKIVARLPLEHMTIKTHYAYAKWLRFLIDATYKARVVADRNKSILRDYDNQIDLNFGLMKLCVGEFECELERRYQ